MAQEKNLKDANVCDPQVAVDGVWKTCQRDGGPIEFPGFNGVLT